MSCSMMLNFIPFRRGLSEPGDRLASWRDLPAFTSPLSPGGAGVWPFTGSQTQDLVSAQQVLSPTELSPAPEFCLFWKDN